jgi:hypothetical protein
MWRCSDATLWQAYLKRVSWVMLVSGGVKVLHSRQKVQHHSWLGEKIQHVSTSISGEGTYLCLILI